MIGFLIPFISNTAHVGGLITGFAFTLLWLVPPRGPAPGLAAWRAATAALLAGLLFHAVMPVTRYDWLCDFDYENSPVRDMIVDRCRSATLEIERESYENFYFGDRSLA